MPVCLHSSPPPFKCILENLFTMELQIEAKASVVDRCLVINFSSSTSAADYYRYLLELNDTDPAFLRNHDWKFQHKPKTISMLLPESIEIRQSLPYDVELVIQNIEQANAWEEHMLLWKSIAPPRELTHRHFLLSRPVTVTDLENRIRGTKEPRTNTGKQQSPGRIIRHMSSVHGEQCNVITSDPVDEEGMMNWLVAKVLKTDR